MSDNPTLALRREASDLGAVLEAGLAWLAAHAARKDVELRITSRGAVPQVQVDRHRIAWCIATLAGNALRRLRGAHAVGPGTCICVEIAAAPGGVAISVGDDGPAVPMEQLLCLFETHVGVVQADDLALSLIREIVEAHGGSVEVTADEGAGAARTTVTLRLPTAR
jgi:C4-dicarboxylate-specific signal transduction histidine kinase